MMLMMASSWLETSTWWRAGTERQPALKLIVIYVTEIQSGADVDNLWQTVMMIMMIGKMIMMIGLDRNINFHQIHQYIKVTRHSKTGNLKHFQYSLETHLMLVCFRVKYSK